MSDTLEAYCTRFLNSVTSLVATLVASTPSNQSAVSDWDFQQSLCGVKLAFDQLVLQDNPSQLVIPAAHPLNTLRAYVAHLSFWRESRSVNDVFDQVDEALRYIDRLCLLHLIDLPRDER